MTKVSETELLDFTTLLKVHIASFLPLRDAVALSRTAKSLHDELALTRIRMQIPFKSWYDEAEDGPQLKRGLKLPFLQQRTHSVTLTGSWSCQYGELQGKHSRNSQAQLYIVAYPHAARKDHSSRNDETAGGRTVWASRPIYQRHITHSSSSWVELTVSFVPSDEEEYYLCIQPGPGNASHQHWWRHSLHMSNLMAHINYHDKPYTDYLIKQQYKTIVKQILQIDNRGAYYTKVLEAVARSIRIQLARFGRNALDPVLESFFESTGIPRDTDSLLVLEEVARFLSQHAYVSERRKQFHTTSGSGSSSHRGDSSVPDWIPYYAESSVPDTHRGGGGEEARAVPEAERRRRLQHAVQNLLCRLNPFSSGKGKRRWGGRSSWKVNEVTEEISVSDQEDLLSRELHPSDPTA